jgi:F-type H+-transporting ATPase subunit a
MNIQVSDFKYISRFKKLLFLVSLLFAIPSVVLAGDEKGKSFNAGDMILEHVSDAHSWHVAGNYSIPLPIILYSSNHGFAVFCSNKLDDGAIYNGYKLNGEHIVAANADGSVNKEDTAKLWDFSLTKTATTIVFSGLLLLLIMTAVSRGYSKRGTGSPKGIQSFFEPIIVFVRDDLAIPSIGPKKYEKFMPFLLTLFFFILLMNILGLVPFFPGGANVTGNIAITTTLACFTFIVMMANTGKTYWGHTLWMPGVPAWVKISILGPIETLGIILKPFTLLIRIFANMLAGHIVALSFFALIFIFGGLWGHFAGYLTSVFSVAFSAGMLLLDVLVSLIQAYVFTLLSAIYFGMATEEAEHH